MADGATWCLTVPESWESVVRKQAAIVWPGATVERGTDPLAEIRPVAVQRLELKQHYMFPIRADRRTLGALPGLLETMRLLGPGERLAVQVLLDPAEPDWWQGAAGAYEQFRSGRMPKRLRLDGKAVAQAVVRGAALTALEMCSIVEELLVGKSQPVSLDGPSKAAALRELPVGAGVADKLRQDAIDVTIRVGVETASPTTARTLLRSVEYAYRALDGDNALVAVQESPAVWERVRRREPGWKLNPDYLSLSECAMLVMLPTGPLQEEYKLTAVEHRETRLPAAITSGGLRIGVATYRGKETAVYLPTSNHDELCLPHVVIGMMGSGKTTFGISLAYEAVRAGFSAVIIDPAKGEAGDELEKVLPREQLVRVHFGKRPIAIDWREARHSDRARNRLANELIAFCEAATDDAGAQTVRYLRTAAKAVPGGRLSEVVSLLTDMAYLESLLPSMRPQERVTWEQFRGLSDARRTQIALPVLNRLDVIMGDDYLAACMDAADGIDFVALLDSGPKAIVLDIPAGDLGREAVDVLAALCATKLDLAMVLRQSRYPVFVIMDEPHQYLRGARTWRSAAVESRKWRFSYTWLFHAWEQIPKDVAAIIKAAGPHLHLYASSKETYRALAEEIAPWTVEEALRIPRHHALHVLRAGGRTLPPVLVRMDPPPSKRRSDA